MSAIRVPIITEWSGKGLDKADKALSDFGDRTRRSLQGLADFGKKIAIGLAGVGAVATAGAGKAINAASDLAEETSKAGVLFGDAAKDVEAFAATAAKQLGQSKQAALEGANTFAVFGKAAGLAGKDLGGFSTDFVALASDLASFNNTSPEEAIEALGSALRGESEPIRKYGVMLSEASMEAKGLEMGLGTVTKTGLVFTEQEKILIRYADIFGQTADAAGDFERTSDGLANQQRILSAEFANVVAKIGEKLLPIALKLASFMNDKVIPVIEHVVAVFGEKGLSGVFGLVADTIRDKGPMIRDKIIEFLQNAADWIWNVGIPRLLELLGKMGQALIDWIEPRIKPMLNKLGEFIAAGANWLINEGLPKLVDTLIVVGNALVDWIKPRIVPALQALGELLVAILNWVLFEAVPKIAAQMLRLAAELVKWIVDITPEVIKGLGLLLIQMIKWFITDAIPGIVKQGAALGKGIVRGIGEGLANLFQDLVNFGKDIVRKIVEGIRSIAGDIGSAILGAIPGGQQIASAAGTVGKVISKVWPFAEGGIVTGPTLGLVGEAGPEAIIPLDRLNQFTGGGGDINITVTSADPQAVIEAIRAYNRTQGPAPIRVAA